MRELRLQGGPLDGHVAKITAADLKRDGDQILYVLDDLAAFSLGVAPWHCWVLEHPDAEEAAYRGRTEEAIEMHDLSPGGERITFGQGIQVCSWAPRFGHVFRRHVRVMVKAPGSDVWVVAALATKKDALEIADAIRRSAEALWENEA